MRFLALVFGLATVVLLVSLEKVQLMGVSCRVINLQDLTAGFGGAAAARPFCINDGMFVAAIALGGLLALFGAARIVLAGLADEPDAPAFTSAAMAPARRRPPPRRS